MRIHKVSAISVESSDEVCRNSLGGYPILPENYEWPVCEICGQRQTLFFQMDIEYEFELPFVTGSHLSVFMCIDDEELPGESGVQLGECLPDHYWEKAHKHYRLLLHSPDVKERVLEMEPQLRYCELEFEVGEEEVDYSPYLVTHKELLSQGGYIGSQGFKVGGIPTWYQHEEHYRCCCGAEMKFIVQIPEDFVFTKTPEYTPAELPSYLYWSFDGTQQLPHDAPELDVLKSHLADQFLFFGNDLYFFACEKQCHPESVWVIAQR